MEWKKRINVQKVKKLYSSFARCGAYHEARTLLCLLRRGSVTLGLCDADWRVQCALEDAGIPLWFSRDGYRAIAHI